MQRDIIAAIQTELRANLESVTSEKSIFASPSETFILPGADLPAIGLKDGPVTREDLAGDMIAYDIVVHVCLFVELFREEAVLLDDPASDSPGILTLADSVDEILDENTLGITDVDIIHAAQFQSNSSKILTNLDLSLRQTKVLKYRYELEATRP